ncbi:MAG: beta-ketoacyl-[acyl-carrier-protein] synthase family protein [Planctomycetota bacterium]
MAGPVTITGLGVVSGLGLGVDALWDGLMNGRTGLSPLTLFDASAFPSRIAAAVDDGFKVRDFVPKTYRKATKVMCRDIEFAVAAAMLAVQDGRLVTKGNIDSPPDGVDASAGPTHPPSRVGCQIGAGLIVADLNELTAAFAVARDPDTGGFDYRAWGEKGMYDLTPLWLLKYLPNMLACHVTIVHDAQGPSNTITCGETSGALSIAEATRVIERGQADLCFAGGAETKLNPLAFYRQCRTGMLAETSPGDEGNPAAVIRPFGQDARGTLAGEGGAIIMAELAEKADARNATRYADVAGFGAVQACDLIEGGRKPNPSGRSLRRAIEAALADAGITAADVNAIVPAGYGTPAYDTHEQAALEAVFEDRFTEIPLVLTKPNIGACNAAASAIDIAVAAMCVRHQALPPRIGGGGGETLPNARPSDARDANLKHVLVTSMGIGGQNSAMVLRRPA